MSIDISRCRSCRESVKVLLLRTDRRLCIALINGPESAADDVSDDVDGDDH